MNKKKIKLPVNGSLKKKARLSFLESLRATAAQRTLRETFVKRKKLYILKYLPAAAALCLSSGFCLSWLLYLCQYRPLPCLSTDHLSCTLHVCLSLYLAIAHPGQHTQQLLSSRVLRDLLYGWSVVL